MVLHTLTQQSFLLSIAQCEQMCIVYMHRLFNPSTYNHFLYKIILYQWWTYFSMVDIIIYNNIVSMVDIFMDGVTVEYDQHLPMPVLHFLQRLYLLQITSSNSLQQPYSNIAISKHFAPPLHVYLTDFLSNGNTMR